MRPKILELFCSAGGSARGYYDAGFQPFGVDHRAQPRFPYEFRQADALFTLRWLVEGGGVGPFELHDFAAIHASPPCQVYSRVTRTAPARADGGEREHLNLIPQTRTLLEKSGLPYVIENVPDAVDELRDPVQLCGSSFHLPGLQRHRLFETNFPLLVPPCFHGHNHERRYVANRSGRTELARVVSIHGHGGTASAGRGGKAPIEDWRAAMGIDWMNRDELAQAIPPAYTEYIGGFLMDEVRRREARSKPA